MGELETDCSIRNPWTETAQSILGAATTVYPHAYKVLPCAAVLKASSSGTTNLFSDNEPDLEERFRCGAAVCLAGDNLVVSPCDCRQRSTPSPFHFHNTGRQDLVHASFIFAARRLFAPFGALQAENG
jgi:hypothetical protein